MSAKLTPQFSKPALKALAQVYGNSKLLGFGEGIHTSDGFYQAKLEVFRYLIEHHGLRLILFETPWSRGEIIEEYLSGSASLADAMNGLLYVWQSESIASFLEWLKSLRDRGIVVEFRGIDIQSPEKDFEILSHYGHAQYRDQFAEFVKQDSLDVDFVSLKEAVVKAFHDAQEIHSCRDALLAMADEIEGIHSWEHDRLTLAKTSLSEYVRAVTYLSLGNVLNDQSLYLKGSSIRDRGMAKITECFLGDRKAVLWAHNLHIIKHGLKNHARPHFGLGDLLSERYERDYQAIAISSYDCDINWPQIPDMRVIGLPHHEESAETMLGKTDDGFHFYPLRGTRLGKTKRLLQAIEVDQLEDHFDGLIYMNHSPAMVIFPVD